jgi:subtilisin family serine protease
VCDSFNWRTCRRTDDAKDLTDARCDKHRPTTAIRHRFGVICIDHIQDQNGDAIRECCQRESSARQGAIPRTHRRCTLLSRHLRGWHRLTAAVLTGFVCLGVSAAPAVAAPPPPTALLLAEPIPLTSDPVRDDQWQLQELDMANAWTYADGTGITVAVIDSGVDATHSDLQGQVLTGLDLVDDKGTGDTDAVGHGTTVSAIIAGRNDDTLGVVGIAPKAKILPIRVLDAENRYNDAIVVARGVRWAVDNGARVINLSLGGSGSSPALAAALDYAFAKDVVVVACTGNES